MSVVYLSFIALFLWSVIFMPPGEINDNHRITQEEQIIVNSPPKAELIARWLYSPGALNKSHQIPQLTCSHCHPSFQQVPEKKCRECHRPIDFLENSTPVIIDTHEYVKELNCLECHWEHKGIKASISVTFDSQGHEKHLPKDLLPNCHSCHSALGHEIHPTLTEEGMAKCYQCHLTSDWQETDWNHEKLDNLNFNSKGFTRLVLPLPKDACSSCHAANFHGTFKNPQGELGIIAIKGTFDCLICHNF